MSDTTQEKLQLGILSKDVIKHIDHWCTKFPEEKKQSAIIPALRYAQDAAGGWLSEDLIKAVADYLDVPHIKAFEVATFYSMFDLEPVGKYKIAVCDNISCKLNGADKIVDHIKRRLGVNCGETTEDGRYILRTCECMAACTNAPMMQINDREYHENLTLEKVDEILDDIDKQEDGK